MKILNFFAAMLLSCALFLGGCKPKDADIQASVAGKLRENPATAPATVSVTDGVATLGGELANAAARSESETIAGNVKGVKSVINNISITPEAVIPTTTAPVIAADDTLTSSVKDAVKDFPSVTATVSDGVVTLTGEVSKPDRRKIMESVSSLHPKSIDNKLTLKPGK